MVNFVCDEDGPGKLLIVYYAGYGWVKDNSNEPMSLSSIALEVPHEKDLGIQWVKIEQTLSERNSNVLLIFDCSHAGQLCVPASSDRHRSFVTLLPAEKTKGPKVQEKSLSRQR